MSLNTLFQHLVTFYVRNYQMDNFPLKIFLYFYIEASYFRISKREKKSRAKKEVVEQDYQMDNLQKIAKLARFRIKFFHNFLKPGIKNRYKITSIVSREAKTYKRTCLKFLYNIPWKNPFPLIDILISPEKRAKSLLITLRRFSNPYMCNLMASISEGRRRQGWRGIKMAGKYNKFSIYGGEERVRKIEGKKRRPFSA